MSSLSYHHYLKDVKNLSTNWSNITDLVNRSNRIVIVLIFIYSAILMALVMRSLFLVRSLALYLPSAWGRVLILLLALIFGYHYYLSRILTEIEKDEIVGRLLDTFIKK